MLTKLGRKKQTRQPLSRGVFIKLHLWKAIIFKFKVISYRCRKCFIEIRIRCRKNIDLGAFLVAKLRCMTYIIRCGKYFSLPSNEIWSGVNWFLQVDKHKSLIIWFKDISYLYSDIIFKIQWFTQRWLLFQYELQLSCFFGHQN